MNGKNIAVIGLGKEGVAAANFFSPFNIVSIFDKKTKKEIDPKFFKFLKNSKNIKFFLDSKTPISGNFDLIIRSPGVRLDNEILKKISSENTKISTGTQLFFENCPGKIIGVTGTKGKGTTSTLIYETLKRQFKNVFLGGNIGTPALELLPKLDKNSIIVLELSSFQLIDIKASPNIAVVLMTTSEHLDWHQHNKEYILSKRNIVKYQKPHDFTVANADYENSLGIAKSSRAKTYYFSTEVETNGLYLKGDEITSKIKGGRHIVCKVNEISIPGAHNIQNVMAAASVCELLKVDLKNIRRVIQTFKSLKHRLQLVSVKKGISYYNDSYSTTPETAIAALKAFNKPKIIILGGSSKDSDFSSLASHTVSDSTLRGIVLIGIEAKRIKSAIDSVGGFKGKILEGAKNMVEILKQANSIAKSGDVVILSPACASFDMFKNYQDRGEQFIQKVKLLK